MTPQELAAAQKQLGLNQKELAIALKTQRRTLQDWLLGRRRIPGVCEAAIELLLWKDRWMMDQIKPGFVPSRLKKEAHQNGNTD